MVDSGGTEFVYPSATTTGTTVGSGGRQQLSLRGHDHQHHTERRRHRIRYLERDGGQHNGEQRRHRICLVRRHGQRYHGEHGGNLIVVPGGNQTGTQLSGGAIISSGVAVYRAASGFSVYASSASDITVGSGGIEFVLPGGTAISTTMSRFGDQYVYSGGATSDTVLNSGGEYLFSTGMAISTAVNSGGNEYVYSGGVAIDTTVNALGTETCSRTARRSAPRCTAAPGNSCATAAPPASPR